jgi:flagellar protein FliO/FliZ
MSWLGIDIWIWMAGFAVVLVLAGVVIVAIRRRKRRRTEPTEAKSDNRIAVLESTVVDAERTLVLVRCDNVEHLIMIGGPADLVVENDVRKTRPGVAPAGKPAAANQTAPRPTADQHSNGADRKESEAQPPEAKSSAPPTPKRAEPRPPQVPAVEPQTRTPPTPRPALAAVPTPAVTVQPKPAARRPEPQLARREPSVPAARALQTQPVPVAANQPEEPVRAQPAERRGELPGDTARAANLPAAEVPWPAEGDSVENEIVRALRADPHLQPRHGGQKAPLRQETAYARGTSDPATTLGDLAERLEEALAREVQAANQGRNLQLGLDAYVTEPAPERTPPAAKERSEQRSRSEARERPEPRVIAPAPESEPRRESRAAPERQEEAPVINLNARRREAVDPLEDEMARLLGELTGDTKRR